MADVELYLDPICPFAWVTSRWLLEAAQSTHTRVTLRQMSLAVLNEGKDLDAKQQQMMQRSRQLGRLFAAVTTKYGADAFARLYDSIGTRIHLRREEITQGGIREALAEAGLDESLSETLDDSGLDDEARHAHQASQAAVGGTAGSPIIAVDGQGFFGPVLTRMPSGADGVRLLEAVLTAAKTPEFAVLQRPYQGPPVLDGTAR
ncbi:DSBA-like thioredoxin domain protein [Mycobacterium shottsii]|uniref:DSBA oxidoreductase n=1 Tax=Mycobacterium shottsii TaxID=133549 RepID=A0A7I7L7H1_9MYCO|nr:DsbA family protein [Mycobacterium shottsii]QYL30726.1 DSBA-like thioredoxin domain protein [Mycobacterium shottsii]BBX55193.1 DSBA oxidoreductase [Mycobacterium shottsii]